MRNDWGGIAVLASLLHLSACGDSGPPQTAGIVQDSAGVRLIDLPPSSVVGAELFLSIDSDWTLGAGLEFGSLTDVAIGPGVAYFSWTNWLPVSRSSPLLARSEPCSVGPVRGQGSSGHRD